MSKHYPKYCYFEEDNLNAKMYYFLQAFPFKIAWYHVYHDPTRPLVVDIGSGIVIDSLFLYNLLHAALDMMKSYAIPEKIPTLSSMRG